MKKIAIIAGFGIPAPELLDDKRQIWHSTPYGETSSPIIAGSVDGQEILVLYRNGLNEDIPSFKVNYKANIYALHELGCQYIISSSMCGSLQEEICPGEFVVFDQFVDLTEHTALSFSDKLNTRELNLGNFYKPFSEFVRNGLIESSVRIGHTVHTKGVVLATDGARQSTRAESNLFRKWGVDVINYTTVPEAILAHELSIEYAAVSLCCYYDTWRTDISPVSNGEKRDVLDLKSEIFSKLLINSVKTLLANDE